MTDDEHQPLPHVVVTNQQSRLAIDEQRLESAVLHILTEAKIESGEMSLVVIDDPTMHELNRKHLNHDYPTDVLSFCLEEREGHLNGEVIVSADTAIENAADYGWEPESELLLYVIHGTLHLVGYRDKADDDVLAMREAEARHLKHWGIEQPEEEAIYSSSDATKGEPLS